MVAGYYVPATKRLYEKPRSVVQVFGLEIPIGAVRTRSDRPATDHCRRRAMTASRASPDLQPAGWRADCLSSKTKGR
jgi:hypothetical protein